MNDPMLGQTDLGTISMAGISNVRVLYGSAGLTNNSGGIGGTIELLSAPHRKKDGFDARLNANAGSFGTYGVAVQVRDRFKRFSDRTAVEYYIAQNNFNFRNLASIAREDKEMTHAAVRRIGANKSVGIHINDRNRLEANIYFAQTDRELPPTMLMANTKEELLDRDIWGALRYRRIGNRSQLTATVSYTYGKQEYSDNNDFTFHHLYQANKNLVRYKYDFGHDLHFEVGADIFNETAKSDSAYRGETHWRFWQALFASLKYVPKKWVAAQVLIREDVIDGSFSPVQGLIGVEVKPTKWLFAKANVSRNFRAPTLNDLYWAPGGNPDLESESGFSWEAGLGVRIKKDKFQLEVTGTYFQSEIDNWIIWLPEESIWTPLNKRAVSTKGVEARLESAVSVGKVTMRLNGSYTYVSSTIKEGATDHDVSIDKQLIYVPEHQAKTNLSIHVSRLFLLYGHNYTGLRYTTSDNENFLPGFQFSYMSFGYTHKFNKHKVGLNFTIENLFNEEYQTIAWRPMPGRSFLINLNYQFQ